MNPIPNDDFIRAAKVMFYFGAPIMLVEFQNKGLFVRYQESGKTECYGSWEPHLYYTQAYEMECLVGINYRWTETSVIASFDRRGLDVSYELSFDSDIKSRRQAKAVSGVLLLSKMLDHLKIDQEIDTVYVPDTRSHGDLAGAV